MQSKPRIEANSFPRRSHSVGKQLQVYGASCTDIKGDPINMALDMSMNSVQFVMTQQ